MDPTIADISGDRKEDLGLRQFPHDQLPGHGDTNGELEAEKQTAEAGTTIILSEAETHTHEPLSQWQYLKSYFGSWDGWVGDYVRIS